jgi:carbon monoxide dehydrogenase subunit G
MPDQVVRSIDVEAPAQRVWELVSDLTGMGRFSPESTGGRWRRGATGPAVGARFQGSNRAGWRRWGTTVEVVRCVPGSAFAFTAAAAGMVAAEWAYDIEPTASGCRVTETWTDRRGLLITVLGRVVTGVADRKAYTATSIEQTLAAVKAVAEAQPQASTT